MRRALKGARIQNPLQIAVDGRAAIDYLSGAGAFKDRAVFPLPKLVLLDLQLPITSGFEVLAWIRAHPQLKALPVAIVSSSEEPVDLERVSSLGINSYIVKPPDASQLLALTGQFNWLVRL